MSLDPALLEILACPDDKGPLYYIQGLSREGHQEEGTDADGVDVLYNPRLKRRYDIRDGIPVMLIAESTTVDDAEHERLMGVVEAEGLTMTFDAQE